MYIPYFVYPFIRWWPFRLFPLFGYSELCYCEHLCRHIFIFLLGRDLGELLSHMVTLCSAFWGTAKLFSKGFVIFYISTRNIWALPLYYIITNIYYYSFYYSHFYYEGSGISLFTDFLYMYTLMILTQIKICNIFFVLKVFLCLFSVNISFLLLGNHFSDLKTP